MGYRSDSIAISRDMGPLSPQQSSQCSGAIFEPTPPPPTQQQIRTMQNPWDFCRERKFSSKSSDRSLLERPWGHGRPRLRVTDVRTEVLVFFQDFEGPTEVFAPGRLPGYPCGRPPDIRPQNLLFGLLFLKRRLLQKSEGNFSDRIPGWILPWIFWWIFSGLFPWKKQEEKIHQKIHGNFQIRILEFRGQNPHCKDPALTFSFLILMCDFGRILWPQKPRERRTSKNAKIGGGQTCNN